MHTPAHAITRNTDALSGLRHTLSINTHFTTANLTENSARTTNSQDSLHARTRMQNRFENMALAIRP